MNHPMIDRRGALKAVGVIGAGAMAALVPTAAWAKDGEDSAHGVAGGWDVTVTFTAGQSKVLIMLAAGGGAMRSGQNDHLTGSLASPSYGSWASLGEREIGITFRNFRYSTGGATLSGTSKIRVRATVNEANTQFTGPFITELFDLTGAVARTITGTVDGRRIPVELP